MYNWIDFCAESLENQGANMESIDQHESNDCKEASSSECKYRQFICGEEALRISPNEPYCLRRPIRRGHFNVSQHYPMQQVVYPSFVGCSCWEHVWFPAKGEKNSWIPQIHVWLYHLLFWGWKFYTGHLIVKCHITLKCNNLSYWICMLYEFSEIRNWISSY